MTIAIRIQGLKGQFDAARRILKQIPKKTLVAETPIPEYGTIGQQFRHMIDFGDILLRDWREGVVDFTRRDKNPALKRNKGFIKLKLISFQKSLDVLDGHNPDMPMRKVFTPVAGKPPMTNISSLGEAVDFVHIHLAHHIPLVVAFAYIHGVSIQNPGGITPDTINARKANKLNHS